MLMVEELLPTGHCRIHSRIWDVDVGYGIDQSTTICMRTHRMRFPMIAARRYSFSKMMSSFL